MPRARPCFAVLALLFALTSAAGTAQAQEQPGIGPTSSSEVRLYVGMWTAHLKDLGRGFDNNWLLGVSWEGYYGGTFVNSYGDRAFTLGIQRKIAQSTSGTVQPGVGWRLGLVTGYDTRFSRFASVSPILPFGQLVGEVGVGQTGVEMGWTPLTASLGPSFSF